MDDWRVGSIDSEPCFFERERHELILVFSKVGRVVVSLLVAGGGGISEGLSVSSSSNVFALELSQAASSESSLRRAAFSAFFFASAAKGLSAKTKGSSTIGEGSSILFVVEEFLDCFVVYG